MLSQIGCGSVGNIRIVLEHSESCIASVAQDSAYFFRLMAMINARFCVIGEGVHKFVLADKAPRALRYHHLA